MRPVLLVLLAAALAAAEPLPRLMEWERGVALRQQDRDDLTMFLWFYEWNLFEAMSPGQHTPGSFKTKRDISASRGTITYPGLDLRVEAAPDGARLTLKVTNVSGHDWPELAAIIPCWNPGKVDGVPSAVRQPLNVNFADSERDRSYFHSAGGLTLLDSRAIHFNHRWRAALDKIEASTGFVFSSKWPTSEVNANRGLLVRESADRKWVTGIGWEDYLSVQGHNPWSCLHASIRVGPLKRGESKTIRGRLFLFPGNRQDALDRWHREFPNGARK